MLDTLSRHDHQLVELNSDWAIADVQNRTLTLSLECIRTCAVCPEFPYL
jgi:hypothetical protein